MSESTGDPGFDAMLDASPIYRAVYEGMARDEKTLVKLAWHWGARDALSESIDNLRAAMVR